MILWLTLAHAASISGVVVDEVGDPVGDALVVVYDQRLGYATADTDDGGAFVISDLPENSYRVRVLPPSSVNLMEHWVGGPLADGSELLGGLDLCQGAPVPLGDAPVDLDPVWLSPGGVIRGRVLELGGEPVDGVEVWARSANTASTVQPRLATTDEAGDFEVAGVPLELEVAGEVTIGLEVEGWPEQFVGGSFDVTTADVVQVQPSVPLELGDLVLADGVTVGGSVMDEDGNVVVAGSVTAFSTGQSRTVGFSDGAYLVDGLPPGEVFVWAQADDLATTYLPNGDRPGETVSIAAGESILDADITMPDEARLVGQLIGEGDLSDTSVIVYNDARTVGFGASVDEDGHFEVGGLHGGNYGVTVYAGETGYLDEDLTATGLVALPDGEVLEQEFVLTEGATIEGTVHDRYTGEPIYGAVIFAFGDYTAAVSSDLDGTYELSGLAGGTWTLRATYSPYCVPDPDWTTVFYPQTPNELLAAAVEVESGDTVTWAVTMPPDRDHDGMDDVWEEQMGLDPTVDDGREDADGDGFSNLDEYRLGTDPLVFVEDRLCGCGGGSSSWLVLPLLALWRRRST